MQCLCTRSLYKLPLRGLLARSLEEISVQALYKSSVGKISVRDLLARSQQIFMHCLCTKSLYTIRGLRGKISAHPLYKRPPCQDLCARFLDYQNEHLATTRAIWEAQSDEKVARAIPKSAPHHSESDLTGPKWREGCASDPKISTAPQQERSNTHKVPRRLRQHMSEFHKTSRTPRKWTWKIEKKQKRCFT